MIKRPEFKTPKARIHLNLIRRALNDSKKKKELMSRMQERLDRNKIRLHELSEKIKGEMKNPDPIKFEQAVMILDTAIALTILSALKNRKQFLETRVLDYDIMAHQAEQTLYDLKNRPKNNLAKEVEAALELHKEYLELEKLMLTKKFWK
ncbi:MAG: hypothetical protein ABH821_05410 [archaeon]